MELFLESFPKIFISGIVMTLPLALVSFIIAMLIAIVCAMVQYAKVPVMKYVVLFFFFLKSHLIKQDIDIIIVD